MSEATSWRKLNETTHSSASQRHCNIYTAAFHFHHENDPIQHYDYSTTSAVLTVKGTVRSNDSRAFPLISPGLEIRSKICSKTEKQMINGEFKMIFWETNIEVCGWVCWVCFHGLSFVHNLQNHSTCSHKLTARTTYVGTPLNTAETWMSSSFSFTGSQKRMFIECFGVSCWKHGDVSASKFDGPGKIHTSWT